MLNLLNIFTSVCEVKLIIKRHYVNFDILIINRYLVLEFERCNFMHIFDHTIDLIIWNILCNILNKC
jgi:hypothetical protein